MFVNVLDLESVTDRVRQFVDSLGEDAHEWPELRMAAIRGHVRLPGDVFTDLPRPPALVNRQRWAVLDGLEAFLSQAVRHWAASAPNGNADLARVAGGDVDAWPVVDLAARAVVASSEPPRRTRLGRMAAVNLSLGLNVPGAFDAADPINVATERVADIVPVVMAAGNASGLRSGAAAFTKWAKAPWVISVTALRDERIAPDAAVGDPAQDAAAWPTVAAPDDRLTVFHADTGTVEAYRGTSIAAAVVTAELICLASFCLTVRSAVQERYPGDPEGVARVGAGILDTGFDLTRLPEPSWPYGSLPVAGIASGGVDRLAAVLTDSPAELLVPTADALKRLLVASARPVAGHERHEVGHGEISPGTTAVFLARMTAGDYLRHMLGPRPDAGRTAAAAGDVPLTDDLLTGGLDIWRSSAFSWLYDFRRPGPLWSLTFVPPQQKGQR